MKRYTGPAKPQPTYTDYFDHMEVKWRIAILVFLIVVLSLDLFYWRPN